MGSDRRQFLTSVAGTAAFVAAGCQTLHSGAGGAGATTGREAGNVDARPRLRAKRLQAGNTVGLICPAGPISPERLEKARQNLSALGFSTRAGTHVLAQHGYTAGTVAQRLEDLHAMFQDPEVDAIWAIRGGYGATSLLPLLDYDLIADNAKLLIGYSDVTALLNAIEQRTGLIGIHGPVASSTFERLATESFGEVAMQALSPVYRPLALPPYLRTRAGGAPRKTSAEGTLVGGNLTLLAAMCGTPFEVNFAGKILLLEDVGEAPYRIDRMLVQLDQTTTLSSAAGIVLGECVDCEAKPGSKSFSLRETLENRLAGLGIPVLGPFPFGHGEQNGSLPIGGRVRLDVEAGTLTLLEPAVR